MISLPESVKNEYKDFNREIQVFANLYLATKTIVNNEYVINYTTFPLTEENNSKILNFKINEKADIYYTSLPYNTMTIEVDNEQGYFTDYNENSIIEQLNEDCYIDLFMKINDGNYYKIMTMNFDKISYSDYIKARLSFFSSIGYIQNLQFKDKNNMFDNFMITTNELAQYMMDNYNITLRFTHTNYYGTISLSLNTYDDLRTFLINCATMGEPDGTSVIFTNYYNNDIIFKKISQYIDETITSDMQLEKTILKKEDTYKVLNYNYYEATISEDTTETYTRTIQNTLQSGRETIVIVDKNYCINTITQSDITSSSNISVIVESSLIKHLLILTIIGNIGDNYTIQINKANIKRIKGSNEITYIAGDKQSKSKELVVNNGSCVYVRPYYFLFIKKPVKSYVEISMMGLPYLEIGDTILVELENRKVKIIIIEIDTSYNDGLIQTIKGYELDWTHKVPDTYSSYFHDLDDWGLLYPNDDLYPSNDLYPN